MRTQLMTRARSAYAVAAIAAFSLFGPPSIHVRSVTPTTTGAPAGAVLLIEGRHHDELGKMNVSGRAEGMQDGKRVTKPLSLTKVSTGHFAVTRQWAEGTPWVLVLTVEQGDEGHNGVAEALVKIDAKGSIVGIEHLKPDVVSGTKKPLRVVEKDVVAALSSIPR
jgi:hypothetical protein